MVNSLSELASFLEDQSVPAWVKYELRQRRDQIFQALDEGREYTITGPDGTNITFGPEDYGQTT